jgi:hypothetical protein
MQTIIIRFTKVGFVVWMNLLKQNLVSQGSGFAGGNGSDGRQSTHGTFVFTDTAANIFPVLSMTGKSGVIFII